MGELELLLNLKDVDVQMLLASVRQSADYQSLSILFRQLLDDNLWGQDILELAQRLNCDSDVAKLLRGAIYYYKHFRHNDSSIADMSAVKPQINVVGFKDTLKYLFKAHGFDLSVYLMISKYWHIVRLVLIDFASINRSLGSNQTIVL